jgi:hypothetical protein
MSTASLLEHVALIATCDPDPLAPSRYSIIYWVDHLADSQPTERKEYNSDLQDGSSVHKFNQKKYLYWLESLSLLHCMSEGVIAVQKLEAIVVSYRNSNKLKTV